MKNVKNHNPAFMKNPFVSVARCNFVIAKSVKMLIK